MFKASWRVLSAFALLAAVGCGDDGGSEPEGSISVSASPSSASIQQGSSGTITVTLTRGGGFDEPVTVTVEGVPTGVTATVAPAQLTGNVTQATVTVNVASTVAPGTYPITVRASASGIGAATAQYSLTVTAAPVANYTLSATAASAQQGASGTSTITIARTNFTGSVALALDNPPAGITGTFNPASTTGNTSTLTINIASTVNPGTVTLTVKGTATGIADKTTTVALTVTAAPTANYTLAATAASVAQGGSGTSTITIARSNFTGGISLALDNPPAGITGTFAPSPTTGDQSILTINVASTVAQGPVTLTVKGTATGVADKTTTVALTVTAPQAQDYTLSVTPTSVNATAGGTAQATVNIARSNFTGTVNLTLDAPPAGITATFNPAAATGNTSAVTVNVAGTVTAGNYNVTIKGTATGIADKSTTLAVVVAAAGSFTIAASPTTLNIAAGTNSSTNVSIVRTNFTTDVALSLVNPPAGITGTFTPATLSGTVLTSALQVNVAGTVTAGNYPITIQGVGGAVTQTTQVTVTVPAAASVTLAMQPTTLSIQQGQSGSSTLNLTRTNFTGNVTPSVTGNPAGMTVTFNPNPITGNSAQVTVNVGASVTPNNYTLTITGAAGAAGNPTTTLGVAVTTSGGGNNIVWDFCTADGAPVKFWRQSGGTWAEVTPTVVGQVTRFSFSISGATGGIAYTLQTSAAVLRTRSGSSSFYNTIMKTKSSRERMRTMRLLANQTLPQTSTFIDTFIRYGTIAELTGYAAFNGCTETAPRVNKTFNVTGMAGGEAGFLGYGPGSASLSPSTPSYDVSVPPGSYDWAAAFGTPAGFPPSVTPTAYRVGRNEAAPGSAVSVNRTGAPAFTTAPFTISGGAVGSLYSSFEFIQGSRGAILGFPVGATFGTSNTGDMLFFAPADRLPTDLTGFLINNFVASADFKTIDARTQLRYFGAPPASATFTLPSSVPAFVVSQPGGLWSVTGSIPTEYQTGVSPVTFNLEGNGGTATLQIDATRGWLTANGMSTTYTLAQPTLPNFLPQWTPAAPFTSSGVFMLGYDELAAPTAGSVLNSGGRVQTP